MNKTPVIQNGCSNEVKLNNEKRNIQYTPFPMSNKINDLLKSDQQNNYEIETSNGEEMNKETVFTAVSTPSKFSSKINSDCLVPQDLVLGGLSLQQAKNNKESIMLNKKEGVELNFRINDSKLKSKKLLSLLNYYDHKIQENHNENRNLLMELCHLENSNKQLLETTKSCISSLYLPNQCNIRNK